MSDKSVWLIERKHNSVTHYFTSYTFTLSTPDQCSAFRNEPECAVQFARKEDAEGFLKTYLSGLGSVHEHIWMEPTP